MKLYLGTWKDQLPLSGMDFFFVLIPNDIPESIWKSYLP